MDKLSQAQRELREMEQPETAEPAAGETGAEAETETKNEEDE